MTIKNHQRKYERIIGLLFIIATLTYSTGSNGITLILTTSTYINTNLILYALLETVNSVAVILIGFLFYQLLQGLQKPLLKGYLITRLLEGFFLLIGTIFTLVSAQSASINSLLYHDTFFNIAMLILGIYSTFFFFKLSQIFLGLRWLMLLGVIGYICLIVYAILALIPNVNASMMLFIPGGLFEIILPLVLIFKGLGKNSSQLHINN